MPACCFFGISIERVSEEHFMDRVTQIEASVSSIQRELNRISRLAQALATSPSQRDGLQNKLIDEFNIKLRAFKAKNQLLRSENESLKLQVLVLQNALDGMEKKLASLPQLTNFSSSQHHKRKRTVSHEPKEPVEPSIQLDSKTLMCPPRTKRVHGSRDSNIMSSPIKIDEPTQYSGDKVQTSRNISPLRKASPRELTSSQFNMLPTQYSDASSLPKKDFDFGKPINRETSPEIQSDGINSEIEDEDFIVDSQEEFEPINPKDELYKEVSSPDRPIYPSNYTALQRADFLRTYYRLKLENKSCSFDLSSNPVTEKAWASDDFIPNPDWRPAKPKFNAFNARPNPHETNYNDFFKHAGYGAKPTGPVWTDTAGSKASDYSIDEDYVKSQIMDKYLSPPGYMIGDFLSTQEAAENKAKAKSKELERVNRRLQSALNGGEFIFFEEILNAMVRAGRVKSHTTKFLK